MTAFTEDEQWDHDYDLFVTDKNEKIGCLSHVGWRLLPPSIAKSKEDWETLRDFFHNLPVNSNEYEICPDFDINGDKRSIVNLNRYFEFYGGMALRGLYSYDSFSFSRKERPYFRVAIPKVALTLNDLP